MELTREEIVELAKPKEEYVTTISVETIRTMASKLLDEMDKQDIWSKSPEWASVADVVYHHYGDSRCLNATFTRTLPKSPEREIAENKARDMFGMPTNTQLDKIADVIESAINEYKERTK